MFPTVGTLYARKPEASDLPKPSKKKTKYFARIPTTADTDMNRPSIALSRTSSEDVTRMFASLQTVFDFADFAATQSKVSSDSEVFVNLIQRMRHDVTEASRLYASYAVKDYLESWPDKKIWIDNILHDSQRALNDIGVYMDTVHVSGDDSGTVARKRKFEWILSHHKRLMGKQQYLTLCHQSLMATVQVMLAVEMNATFTGQDPIHEMAARPWMKHEEGELLRSPHSRQRLRSNSRNQSVPSITVSDAEEQKANGTEMQPIDSVPAELPGSTPDDLPDPENWDLYAPPPKLRSLLMSAVHVESSTVPSTTEKHAASTTLGSNMNRLDDHHALGQPPTSPTLSRRSFDQVRPLRSIMRERLRPSLSQALSRAHTDQISAQPPVGREPRASFDQVAPMPTVSEKPLERLDSTASVSVADAAPVPLSSMRFRPKAVNVKRPPKHRSLPSELPSFPSQTSLMDDLSIWLVPASTRQSYQSSHSIDTTGSLGISTPSSSTTSSPIMTVSPTSSHLGLRGTGSFAASPLPETTSTGATTIPVASTFPKAGIPVLPSYPPPPVPQASIDTKDTAPSVSPLRSKSEPIVRLQQAAAPEPLLQEPLSRKPVPVPKAQKSESDAIAVQHTISAQPALSNIVKTPGHPLDGGLDSKVLSTATTRPAPPVPKQTEPSQSNIPATPAQPLTAQAKRRAAHARRMQIALG